uniref:Neur_chan_LBD domain-containing protein n=2 Tax=Onchocerca TaxID=6281 RepID=A0A8R1U2B2_ONCVO
MFQMIKYILSVVFIPFICSQLTTQELEEENAQEIANRTYVEEQNELQRTILSKYNRRVRPVLNISEPLDVAVHVYIMHISVDQMEQTITLNGHIYMTWKDEYAVWEPSEHNGVRITMLKQWEIWTPELRITNSVSGIGQFFEISKRSHVIIHSNGKAWSRIEIYPTFSIKIGCKFDYSAYPIDTQICALGIYTTDRMSQVQLSVYYNMQPTVLLGWGNQSNKKHISDWLIDSVTMNISYFNGGIYKAEKPTDVEELDVTWSILYTWLTLHRNASSFTLTLLLPALISYMFIIFPFFLPSPDSAIYILLANLFFIGIFLEDLTIMIPPAIGHLPKIVWFIGINLVLTMMAIFLHLWLRYLLKREDNVTRWYLHVLHVKKLIPKRWRVTLLENIPSNGGIEENATNTGKQNILWTTIVNYIRTLLVIIYFCIFLITLIIVLS